MYSEMSGPLTMNDENRPPCDEDANLSMSSVKAGAAVFGDIFASEHIDHSLCYSPSPFVDRSNNRNLVRQPAGDGKVLNYDPAPSASKPTATVNAKCTKLVAAPAPSRPNTGLGRAKPMTKGLTRTNSRPASAALPIRPSRTEQRDVVRDDVGSGSGSVNPIINNVRRSKEESMKERMLSVAELREQRRQEREEVAAFNVKAEKTRREVIELRKKLSERFRQAKLEREQREREENLAKVENEIQFKSLVHVEHKKTLKEQEDARRRRSTNDRAKLRQNHREGKERMRLASIQEDEALFEERHESSVASRITKVQNAESRRKSFAFRNGDARRIRELFAKREADRMHDDHESFELKWAGERDADSYKKQLAEQRRESLAFRNAEARRLRDLEVQMKVDELHDEHESFELKWAGERDAEDYEKEVAQSRRDSLAFRNAEGRRIRDLESDMKSTALQHEHESFELKWAGERDAEDYEKEVAQSRRDSLAFRNAEGRRIRDLESDMKSTALLHEHESYELKWAGERDAEDYEKEVALSRRDSLAFRNAEGRRIRDLESDMKSTTLQHEHESYELKWAGERDAEDYEKEVAQSRRDSLAFRNAEGRRIRDLESDMKSTALQHEHESFELKWAGERDAEDYEKEVALSRRDSLAFRNAEGRRIRDLESDMKSTALQHEHESFELKWAGERDAEDYEKEVAQSRRDSLAFRNAEGRRIRDLESDMKSTALQHEHESYELKWAGERDAEDYEKEVAQSRRDSLAFRNAEGRRIRDLESDMKSTALQHEHESFELKWAGERDAEVFKTQQARKRRESLEFRGIEAVRHNAVMQELLSLAREREHESYMLKWAAENDSKQYIADQEELRRKSLAQRNAEARHHRDIDADMKVKEMNEVAKDEELKAACQRDVQRYREECAARNRASLRLRGKVHFANRMQKENERQVQLQDDHESHLLNAAAWQDVNDYVKECNRRKRLSLAFRANEKRRHYQLEKQQAELRVQQQHHDTQCRSEDARYVEMAKLKEKARLAIESFSQHPSFTFGSNPFANLLE